MNNLSVILCTYNEVASIKQTLDKLISREEVNEIIIIDDSSKDGTINIIESYNNKKIKFYIRKDTKGFASAFIFGLFVSNGEHILRFDLDMHDDIDYFINEYKNNINKDCIIFSRYVDGGKDLRGNFRKVSSSLINKFCQLLLSKKIKDYTSCVMIFKRSLLKDNIPNNSGYANFIIEFVYKLILLNKNFLEIAYIQKKKTELNSKSATNIFIFLKNGFYYLITIIKCYIMKIFN